jgi:hypothetical protein
VRDGGQSEKEVLEKVDRIGNEELTGPTLATYKLWIAPKSLNARDGKSTRGFFLQSATTY